MSRKTTLGTQKCPSFKNVSRSVHKRSMSLLFGVAVVNAYVLCNEKRYACGKLPIKIAAFRQQICESLLARGLSNTAFSSVSFNRHILKKIDQKQTGKRSDRLRGKTCVNCYEEMTKTLG